MRAFSGLLVAAAAMVLCTGAFAQDKKAPATPPAPGSAATTGAAPSGSAAQAPIGHRQPRSDTVPNGGANAPLVSPYDQEIDRSLNICRGC